MKGLARLAVGIVGGILGSFVGMPYLGFALGSLVGGMLFRDSPGSSNTQGPRLDDLTVQSSAYGAPIARIFGTCRVAGNILWAMDVREVATTTEVDSGGGKGGGGGGSTQTTYSYFATFAVGLCRGPAKGLLRIWADNKVIYDAMSGLKYGGASLVFYDGSETQEPDPVMEAAVGVGQCPAYRGLAYVRFSDLPLEDFGNRIPNLSFEIAGIAADPENRMLDREDGAGYSIDGAYATAGTPDGHLIGVGQVGISGFNPGTLEVREWRRDGDDLVLHARVNSGVPGGSYVGLTTIEVSPSGQFAAILSVGSTDQYVNAGVLVLYDRRAGTFGAPHNLTLSTGKLMSIAWDGNDRPMTWVDDTTLLVKGDGYSAGHDANTYGPTIAQFRRSGYALEFVGAKAIFTYANHYDEDYYQSYAWWGDHCLLRTAAGRVLALTIDKWFQEPRRYRLLATEVYPGEDGPAFGARFQIGKLEPIGWASTERNGVRMFPGRQDGATSEWFCAWTNGNQILSFEITAAGGAITRAPFSWGDSNGAAAIVWAGGVVHRMNGANYDHVATPTGGWGAKSAIVALSPPTGVSGYGVDGRALTPAGGSYFFLSGAASTWLGQLNTAAAGVAIPDVILTLAADVGLGAGDLDLGDISALTVPGFAIRREQTAKDAIGVLADCYGFDGAESGQRIRFVLRGKSAALTIPEIHLGAAEGGNSADQLVQETRSQDTDLPKQLSITYSRKASDYDVSTQVAQRHGAVVRDAGAASATGTNNFEEPLVLGDDEARAVALRKLYEIWSSRSTITARTLPLYIGLEPLDVVRFTANGITREVRITKIDLGANGLIEISGVTQLAAAYAKPAALYGGVAQGAAPQTEIARTTQITTRLLDVHGLTDNDAGSVVFYAAISSPSASWDGAGLLEASDKAGPYNQIGFVGQRATAGELLTAVGPTTATTWDRATTLRVRLEHGDLEGRPELDVLNGKNALLVGEEVIQFVDATEVSAGVWEVSTLLRGRRGTEYAMTHEVGERVVLLDGAGVVRVTKDTGSIGLVRHYKGVPVNGLLYDAPVQAFATTGASLKPYAPCHVRGVRDGAGNLEISWVRRARYGAAWRDGVDVALDEQAEAYDVEILNGSGEVMRTVMTSTPKLPYDLTMQAADFGGVQGAVSVRIYQISQSVGRGRPATATV